TTQNESYIYSTIIDGNMEWSCVTISYCTNQYATIIGFTIQHGSGGYSGTLKRGGGIMVYESVANIENCIIKENIAKSGGGIYATYSTINLKGSLIKDNISLRRGGGILIVYETQLFFDEDNKNSIYHNYGSLEGSDFAKSISSPPINIILDTGTVLYPDHHFFYSYNTLGYPVNDITWQINHGKIEQVNANLYVSPLGDNTNTGLNSEEPLKNLSYAIKKILPDTNNPKSIYLATGLYAPSTNNEIFPVTTRSYVSIIGENVENTILDAEYVYPLLSSYLFTKSVSIENITFRRGTDSQAVISGNGGFNIAGNDSLVFSNIILEQVLSEFYSGLYSNFSNITLRNSKCIDNSGGYALVLCNTQEEQRYYKVINTIVANNGPTETIDEGFGGSVGISGTYSYPNATKATLVNVQITENTLTKEPGTINLGVCGLSCSQNAKVDVINTTIGNNNVTNPVNSAQVFTGEGAEINLYNSIIYGIEDYEIFLGDGTPTSDIATINISNTNVKGGEENIQNWNNIHILNWLDGNSDEDPWWVGGGEPFNYELQPESPCINTGVPMYEAGMDYPYIKEEEGKYILYMLEGDTVTLPSIDLAGNPRISGGRIDMGAYEWQDTTTVSSKFEVRSSKLRVFPNPFKSNTFISFSTSNEYQVSLEVIDMNGNRICTIADNHFPAGDYRLVWDGKDEYNRSIKNALNTLWPEHIHFVQ
ncbi:MAG: hypothetical protein K8R86_07655, partial [Bacteroidales bacterium]|nr:hypothetical protein [Bacteroidales bacterium]